MTALTRTIDLETSMRYRWTDAGNIIQELHEMAEDKPALHSQYPELIARLVVIKCDTQATLERITEALRLCKEQLGVEDARAVDILANSNQRTDDAHL